MGPPWVILVMGVSGAGKSTLGAALAARLGWKFQEGDEFHPPENIAKMAAGVPLTDADRAPWLERVRAFVAETLARGESAVLACSALKRAYRELIIGGSRQVVIVFIAAEEGVARPRLANRVRHFMSPQLLTSQIELLEPPEPDEAPVAVPAEMAPETQVEWVVAALAERSEA